ncbi:hypothetical protein QJS10_CPB04g00882 [Acorus calamus]|uniref:Uncharacterized protein n=1 Tax=Acorus calamus TaxID=4465 RepID=A0AAV9F4F3_ACOCL|nr:hypothetical protein QJS10_CPB04g00882 [Acorus calamus]
MIAAITEPVFQKSHLTSHPPGDTLFPQRKGSWRRSARKWAMGGPSVSGTRDDRLSVLEAAGSHLFHSTGMLRLVAKGAASCCLHGFEGSGDMAPKDPPQGSLVYVAGVSEKAYDEGLSSQMGPK